MQMPHKIVRVLGIDAMSGKRFRGKVTHFNMVCSNCNKLVRSEDIPDEEPEDI